MGMEGDVVLEYMIAPLRRIHKRFFQRHKEEKPVDCRKLLKREKTKVFKGLTFLFSSLYPSSVNMETTKEWKSAVEFGAVCKTTITKDNVEKITHIITTNPKTEKCKIGYRNDVRVVHPNWMHNSTAHYYRCNEKDFSFKTDIKAEPDKSVKVRKFSRKIRHHVRSKRPKRNLVKTALPPHIVDPLV